MKNFNGRIVIALLFAFLFIACEKDDDGEVKTGYLESFSEYSSPKSLSASNIKGYLEQYGQTDLAASALYDVKIFRIEYKTFFDGDSIIASGIISIPVGTKKNDAFPIVSYQHGVITSKNDAPSVTPLGTYSALPSYTASTGFIVIIPDYIGYGSTDMHYHPFMHKTYSSNAVLDFIRAAKEFISKEKPCKTNGKIFLSGYGEGATASLASLSVIENDSIGYSDIPVTATACGAGTYNLIRFREWLLTQSKFDQPWYFAFLLESYSKYSGLDIDYSLIFNEPYASKILGMVDGIKTPAQMNDLFATKSLDELLNPNFKDNTIFNSDTSEYAGLREILAENSIQTWNLKSNVTIYYGKNDIWIPADQSLVMYSDFKNFGVTTKLKINALDGLDHETSVNPIFVRSLNWFKTF